MCSPGLVTIDELILHSANIRLTASGTVAFDGKLKLDSQLAINDKIRGQLFKAIRQNFQPTNEPVILPSISRLAAPSIGRAQT